MPKPLASSNVSVSQFIRLLLLGLLSSQALAKLSNVNPRFTLDLWQPDNGLCPLVDGFLLDDWALSQIELTPHNINQYLDSLSPDLWETHKPILVREIIDYKSREEQPNPIKHALYKGNIWLLESLLSFLDPTTDWQAITNLYVQHIQNKVINENSQSPTNQSIKKYCLEIIRQIKPNFQSHAIMEFRAFFVEIYLLVERDLSAVHDIIIEERNFPEEFWYINKNHVINLLNYLIGYSGDTTHQEFRLVARDAIARASKFKDTALYEYCAELYVTAGMPRAGIQFVNRIYHDEGEQAAENLFAFYADMWQICGDMEKALAYYHRALQTTNDHEVKKKIERSIAHVRNILESTINRSVSTYSTPEGEFYIQRAVRKLLLSSVSKNKAKSILEYSTKNDVFDAIQELKDILHTDEYSDMVDALVTYEQARISNTYTYRGLAAGNYILSFFEEQEMDVDYTKEITISIHDYRAQYYITQNNPHAALAGLVKAYHRGAYLTPGLRFIYLMQFTNLLHHFNLASAAYVAVRADMELILDGMEEDVMHLYKTVYDAMIRAEQSPYFSQRVDFLYSHQNVYEALAKHKQLAQDFHEMERAIGIPGFIPANGWLEFLTDKAWFAAPLIIALSLFPLLFRRAVFSAKSHYKMTFNVFFTSISCLLGEQETAKLQKAMPIRSWGMALPIMHCTFLATMKKHKALKNDFDALMKKLPQKYVTQLLAEYSKFGNVKRLMRKTMRTEFEFQQAIMKAIPTAVNRSSLESFLRDGADNYPRTIHLNKQTQDKIYDAMLNTFVNTDSYFNNPIMDVLDDIDVRIATMSETIREAIQEAVDKARIQPKQSIRREQKQSISKPPQVISTPAITLEKRDYIDEIRTLLAGVSLATENLYEIERVNQLTQRAKTIKDKHPLLTPVCENMIKTQIVISNLATEEQDILNTLNSVDLATLKTMSTDPSDCVYKEKHQELNRLITKLENNRLEFAKAHSAFFNAFDTLNKKSDEIEKIQRAKEAKQQKVEVPKLEPKVRIPRPKKKVTKVDNEPAPNPLPETKKRVIVGPAIYNIQDLSENPYLLSMRIALKNIEEITSKTSGFDEFLPIMLATNNNLARIRKATGLSNLNAEAFINIIQNDCLLNACLRFFNGLHELLNQDGVYLPEFVDKKLVTRIRHNLAHRPFMLLSDSQQLHSVCKGLYEHFIHVLDDFEQNTVVNVKPFDFNHHLFITEIDMNVELDTNLHIEAMLILSGRLQAYQCVAYHLFDKLHELEDTTILHGAIRHVIAEMDEHLNALTQRGFALPNRDIFSHNRNIEAHMPYRMSYHAIMNLMKDAQKISSAIRRQMQGSNTHSRFFKTNAPENRRNSSHALVSFQM